MLPPTPPWLAPRYVLTGIRLSIAALLLILAVVGCTTQTVRLEGFQIRVPLIGSIGPQGWKPYAQELEGEVRSIRIDLELSEAKHVATKRAYREAQEEAARQQAEMIAHEVARQERITDEVRKDYQQRIAALRARADRLRQEARAGAGSEAGSVRLPAEAGAAGGTDAAPDCQRFPAPDPVTDLQCREIATAQAMQLDALISWVQQQVGGGGQSASQ